MGDIKFRNLYKDEPERSKLEPIEESAEKPEQGFLARHRLKIGLLLAVVGFLLFSLQSLSLSSAARPFNTFTLLLVEDLPPEQEDESAEQDTTESREPHDFSVHYREKPSEGFTQRFKTLAESTEIPEGIKALPIELLRRESRFLVKPAHAPEESSDPLSEYAYLVMRISEADARYLLTPLLPEERISAGRLLMGPFPFRADDPQKELILLDGRRAGIAEVLPGEASALQGLIVAPASEVAANALLLVPRGELTVGDFSQTLGTLGGNILENYEKFEKELRLRPGYNSSDFRHEFAIFALTALGEILFLAGGFLLFFHLFAKIGRKPFGEGQRIRRFFIDSCRLISAYSKVYAILIAFVLGFWLWGMFTAHFDPGTQRGVINWIREQFAGGSWPLGVAGWAYASGNIFLAALITFVVNFAQGTVLFLSLPSLIPIASAFIVNVLRGQLIGMALAPTYLGVGQTQILHLPTILLELQGYLLAGFVSILLPLALIKPERFGLEKRGDAYKKFAIWQFRILPLIAVILLIAAAYEAFELIVLVNLMR